MSRSPAILALPAILLGGLLTGASAQPGPVAPAATAVLDALRTTYQNVPAYHFERALLVQESRNAGPMETIAELTLAVATEGAKWRADQPFPPMNGDRFRLATRTRQNELLQVCDGEACWSYSSLRNEYMVGKSLRDVSTSVGGSMQMLVHLFPFLMLQPEVMQDVRVAREEEIVVGRERRTCRVIEGVIRPRPMPSGQEGPQALTPGAELLLSILVLQGLAEVDGRTQYWPWPREEPTTEAGEPTQVTLWVDTTDGVIVRSQLSARLFKRFLDDGAVAVEKVSVVVTDSFTTATVGRPPADMFRFTRPDGAQEVPNGASRRRQTPESPMSPRPPARLIDITTVAGMLPLMTTPSSGADARGRTFVAGQEEPHAVQAAGPIDPEAIRRHVKEGLNVRITDDEGREWHGRIGTLAPDSLVLLTKDRQRHQIPYATIVAIERPQDTLGNGALVGFVSGAGVGVLAVIAEENAGCDPGAFFSCGDPTAAAYFLVPAITGALGTGIGVAIDALIRRDPTLFRRGESRVTLAPSLSRGVRGVSLSVRW